MAKVVGLLSLVVQRRCAREHSRIRISTAFCWDGGRCRMRVQGYSTFHLLARNKIGPRRADSSGPGRRACSDHGPRVNCSNNSNNRTLDFDSGSAFRDKSTGDLLRGLVVLKLSSYQKFVDHSLKIMTIAQSILGRRLFELVARGTFYGHFIAGHGEAEASRLFQRFEEQGIATILASTVEEDIGEHEGYDEARYDRNMKAYIKSMNLTVTLSTRFRPVSQLKLTSFAKADVLARMTEVLSGKGVYYQNDSPLSVWNLARGLGGEMIPIPELTDEENSHLECILRRLNEISEQAVRNNSQILVDAEKINVNGGITLITLALMLKFNKKTPLIWNTYQCYLKRTFGLLQRDLQWAEGEDLCFGVKIVRGAYMDWERKNAQEHHVEDPINADFEATCDIYNAVVDYMLTHIHKNPDKCGMMVASHNKDSVHKAAARMEELGLQRTSGAVTFGQVLGISDQITKTLGQAGYLIYKSSPYGPVDEVLPYLARRAQENSSIFQNLRNERRLMFQELRRRMSPF